METDVRAPRKILVATDFSDVAEHAVDYARDFAEKVGGELVILHVYEVPMLALPIEGAAISPATWAADLSNHWQKKLEESTARRRGGEVPVT